MKWGFSRLHAHQGFSYRPVFRTPYSNFGHPQIWDFIIEMVGIGHLMFMKNCILDYTPFQNPG